MSEPTPYLLEFPCEFPIKAIGRGGDDFAARVAAIVRRHAPDQEHCPVSCRPSKGGKFTAVTIGLQAHSQAQLDAIYRDLNACVEVIMVL